MADVKRVFSFDMLNSTNETATIFYTGDYGEVHQWFDTDNPSTVIDEAHIGATGMGYVSGFFTIQFPGEGFKIEFCFNGTDYPTFTPTKLPGQTNPNNYHIDITKPPKVEGLSAEVSFQIVDPGT